MRISTKDFFAREHLTSAIIGLLFAVVVYFPLRPYLGDQGALYLGLISAVLSVIISDRIFFQARMRELRDYIHDTIMVSPGFGSTSRYFRNTYEALEYGNAQISKAVRIWNTRLYDASRAPTFADISSRKIRQDDLILKQVLGGATFEFICNCEYSVDLDFFRKGYLKQSRNKGEILLYAIDTFKLPLIQMIIFEFENGSKEALVGWVFSKKRRSADAVWAVRDERMVAYFLALFDIYKEGAEAISVL